MDQPHPYQPLIRAVERYIRYAQSLGRKASDLPGPRIDIIRNFRAIADQSRRRATAAYEKALSRTANADELNELKTHHDHVYTILQNSLDATLDTLTETHGYVLTLTPDRHLILSREDRALHTFDPRTLRRRAKTRNKKG